MRVKVGNKVYDESDGPIMVILTDEDKENIANMHPMAYKYACFPDGWNNAKRMEEWMSEEDT